MKYTDGHIDWALITKVLSGKASEAEKAALETWLATDSAHQELFDELSKPWEESVTRVKASRAFAMLNKRLNEEDSAYKILNKTPHRPLISSGWWRIAATITVLLCLSFTIYQYGPDVLDRIDPLIYTEQFASKGHRLEITLSDGSHVFLNADSHLRYPKQFKRGKREVFLEGEAFFDVVRDPKKPFVVTSGLVRTQVFGTSFNVKAYLGEDISVAVVTGKVSVVVDSLKQPEILLTPNQKATYSWERKQLLKSNIVKAQDYAAWHKGKIIFEGTSLREVANTLSRNFDVDVFIQNAATGNRRLTAEFEDQSLEEILYLLCNSTVTRYKKTGNHYIIHD